MLDGYKATHTIRHTAPFVNNKQLQNTPIVAMTASAIQGDREKCESAGMNDYLAKPVKGKILERMLIKWATTRRKHLAEPESGDLTRLGRGQNQPLLAESSRSQLFDVSEESTPPAREKEAPANPEKLEFKLEEIDFASNSALARSSETPVSRALQHLENDEMAIKLRDEQLISSGDDPKEQVNHFEETEIVNKASDQKLTRENIEKLSDERHAGRVDEETSSLAVAYDDNVQHASTSKRAPLGARVKSEGEQTVLSSEQ